MKTKKSRKKKSKKKKHNYDVLIAVVVVLFLIGRCSNSDRQKDSKSDRKPVTTQSTEIKSQETETTEATTESTTTTTAKVPELSELEILRLENHPKLFDSSEKAETVWAGYIGDDSVIIQYADTKIEDYESPVIILKCYDYDRHREVDSDINEIRILFKNFKKNRNISFETGLEIAKEYFPYDVISEHYTFSDSYYQILESGEKSYRVIYKLNSGEDTKNYPSSWVSVTWEVNESETVDYLLIDCSNHSYRFEPEKLEWNYDLLSSETIELTEITTTSAETTTTTTATVTEPPTEAPVTEPPPPPEPVQPVIAESNYVLNASTMKAHYPNCRDVDRIDPENRWDYYGTVEDVQAMGYSSCGHCHTW